MSTVIVNAGGKGGTYYNVKGVNVQDDGSLLIKQSTREVTYRPQGWLSYVRSDDIANSHEKVTAGPSQRLEKLAAISGELTKRLRELLVDSR